MTTQRISLIALAAVLALGGGWLVLGPSAESAATVRAAQEVPTFTAKRRPLLITIKEAGQLKAKDQIAIKSEVSGNATIISLVPEGTVVKEGDLLVELDASTLEDDKIEQEIRVQNAETSYISAREKLEIAKSQAESDIAQARNDLKFARADLDVYVTGDGPRALMELEAKIKLAEEELVSARRQVEGSRKLLREEFISATELESDELSLKKSQLDLDLAREDLRLFEQHTRPRSIEQLEASITLLEQALDRAEAQARSNILQAEADLKAKEAELAQQRNKLSRIEREIEKSRIIAPRAGMVVYATSTQASWRGNEEPLAEGQAVRERQELIHLPTADGMMAVVSIPEARLRLVQPGLPVQISVDALPGKVLAGVVRSVAVMPDARSQMMNPDLKIYDTEIELTQLDPALRTGMGVQAEIIAARNDNALVVPIQAVQRSGRQAYVFVKDGQAWQPRKVETGLDDLALIEITDGLAEGDVVSLTPPLDGLPAPDMSEMEASATDLPPPPNAQAVDPQPAADGPPGEAQRSNRRARRDRGDGGEGASEGGGQDSSGRGRGGGRWSNLSEEERAAMRTRMQNMSEEERQRLRERYRNRSGEQSSE